MPAQFLSALFPSLLATLILFYGGPAEASKDLDIALKPFVNKLQEGQVLAMSEPRYDGSTFFFEAVTGSRYGHIGIVMKEKDKWVVYEANPPIAGKVPLNDFLGRSLDHKGQPQATLIGHKEPLTASEVTQLRTILESMLAKKIPYDFQHDALNEKAMDCSEFVFRAFRKLKRPLGVLEGLKTLNTGSFGGFLMKFFEDLTGVKPSKEQRFVSPSSIVRDPRAKVVLSTLQTRFLSDLEILEAWKRVGGLPHLAGVMYAVDGMDEARQYAEQIYQTLKPLAGKKPYRTKTVGICAKST